MAKHRRTTLALFALGAVVLSCGRDPPRRLAPDGHGRTIVIVPRTPEIATYPCVAACHVRVPANPTPRELRTFHAGKVLRHSTTIAWCTFCHQDDNLDRLHLIDGTLVSFDEAYRVCAQCHEDRYRDWTRGIHGSTTGSWRDVGIRRSCPVCHDPHDPHRGPFNGLPPPSRERGHPAESPHE